MTFKELIDVLTGAGVAISALTAGVAAWAARTSARAAEESSKAANAAIKSNERIAENDRRIRLMEERLKVWRAFDSFMDKYTREGIAQPEDIIRLSRECQRAPFIFPEEVPAYLKTLNNRLFSQIFDEARAEQRRQGMNFHEDVNEQHAELERNVWLSNQQGEGRQLFKKHMSLID